MMLYRLFCFLLMLTKPFYQTRKQINLYLRISFQPLDSLCLLVMISLMLLNNYKLCHGVILLEFVTTSHLFKILKANQIRDYNLNDFCQ